MKRQVNKKSVAAGMKNQGRLRGRPAGSNTRYPGIMRFVRSYGCSHQHARRVLDGLETSAPLMEAWADWQLRRA